MAVAFCVTFNSNLDNLVLGQMNFKVLFYLFVLDGFILLA